MLGGVSRVAVIPAYKEELTIASVVILAKKHVDKVIVVDDGSPDRTSEIADAAGAMVLRMEKNGGKAKALAAGLAMAKELRPEVTVMIDADGQMDPDEMANVMTPVLHGNADLVIGSRFLDHESYVPKHRRVGQEVLTSATNYGAKYKITDSQSGYRALSYRALQNLDFDSSNYAVESEMVVHFETRDLTIVEVPIGVRYDVPKGHKKSSVTHGFGVLEQIISFVGFRRPLYVFGIPAALLTLFGLVLGFFTLFEHVVIFNWSQAVQGLAAVVFFGVGLILGVGALILNALCRLIEETGRTHGLSGNVKHSDKLSWRVKHFIDGAIRFLSLRHPMFAFGIPGTVAGFIGFGFTLMALTGHVVMLNWSAMTQGVFGVFLIVMGSLFFSTALIMNSLGCIYEREEAARVEAAKVSAKAKQTNGKR
jgi:glycosyltransferase involved in cell wall biosynthesis